MAWFSGATARLMSADRAIPDGVSSAPVSLEPAVPLVAVDQLAPTRYRVHDGEKFSGGLGAIELLLTDYWGLRARSAELFERNLYARGLVRRIVTNVIATGLHPEATPVETLLGLDEGTLEQWAEDVEQRFELWGKHSQVCDFNGVLTFGGLQREMWREALVSGDVLVVLTVNPVTGRARVRLVRGDAVQTPPLRVPKLAKGHAIKHGVEVDAAGRHVAYWIRKTSSDGREVTSERLAARGPRSGRRVAWLVYGTDRRMGEVRGQPLLAIVIQSLKEIDRYRDSIQRKAVVNSMIALFIRKSSDKPGSLPMGRSASRAVSESEAVGDGSYRSYTATEYHPGLTIDALQEGEEPVAFQSNTASEAFGEFEEAVLRAIAWCFEIPPEILLLKFSSNYSASQAATNEFKLFLDAVRSILADDFCQPIYVEWLVNEVLAQRVMADGLIDAWRRRRSGQGFEVFASWVHTDWAGAIKPSVDPVKLTRAYREQIAEGLTTRQRATREINGQKFSRVIKQLAKEAVLLAEALAPIKALSAPSDGGGTQAPSTPGPGQRE